MAEPTTTPAASGAEMPSFEHYYQAQPHKAALDPKKFDWKEVPEEERQKGFDLIAQHNKSPDIDEHLAKEMGSFYAIQVTGKYQVYFTLWRYRKVDPMFAAVIHNPIYMGNLTTDFLTSVEKCINGRVPKTIRIRIDDDTTRQHIIGKQDVFSFGQYRGLPYYEVYQKNPSYFTFLAKGVNDPNPRNAKFWQGPKGKIILFYANLAREEAIKKNRETSTAEHVGEVKDRYEGPLKVYKMTKKRSFDGGEFTDFRLLDPKGNKFIAYNLEKHWPDIKEGDEIKVQGRIKGHKELMGIKFNQLNYVKPAK